MKFNELDLKKNASVTRVGRGIAAGKGKTAGRGTKGQGARTGKKLRPGFEGGQTPLMQRLPKLRGFRSHHVKPEEVYTGQLETLTEKNIDSAILADAGLISSPFVKVKLLVRGELTKAVTVELTSASAKAIEAVEAAGGSFKVVSQVGRPKVREDKKA